MATKRLKENEDRMLGEKLMHHQQNNPLQYVRLLKELDRKEEAERCF